MSPPSKSPIFESNIFIPIESFRSTFNEFSSRLSKDERFRAVEKIRDREAWFHEYTQELRTREKDGSNRHYDKEKVGQRIIEYQSDYFFLLAEERFFCVIKRIKSQSKFFLVGDKTFR
jgi:transcription elongation regulator 1